jgi:hypothetical protein
VCGAYAVNGDNAPLNLIINLIDIGQLNNSNPKTWNWLIRYGINQLNSLIDQSLVSMVIMKHLANGTTAQKGDRGGKGRYLSVASVGN